jgi:hypothetical protein
MLPLLKVKVGNKYEKYINYESLLGDIVNLAYESSPWKSTRPYN